MHVPFQVVFQLLYICKDLLSEVLQLLRLMACSRASLAADLINSMVSSRTEFLVATATLPICVASGFRAPPADRYHGLRVALFLKFRHIFAYDLPTAE